ncbi:MAG: DNA-directed RNA polymerase subunit K [Desulfurococcales archaeon]|nr:DNA-directed RNA polymerase subunit K [Desulfurococcales archaeon]
MGKDIISLIKETGVRTGPPRLTRYEKARVIAARALQLELGAFPLVDVSNLPKDSVEIAKEELKKGVLPFTLVRSLPNGEKELIPVSKLIELEKKLFGFVEI